jgi:hypothetical protein
MQSGRKVGDEILLNPFSVALDFIVPDAIPGPVGHRERRL